MNQLEPVAQNFLCRFEKCGPIRFISHLDLTRTFHRAFSRARIPLKFSEGFSPHPKFSFALPLSVGTESRCEWAAFTTKAGFEISTEELKDRLQREMPAGIVITKICESREKISEIAFASYEIHLPKADQTLIFQAQKAMEGELVVQRKNKKGKWVEKNVSAGIHSLDFAPFEEGILLKATLAASGEEYLKPELILQVLSEKVPTLDQDRKRIMRTEVYRADLTPFQ